MNFLKNPPTCNLWDWQSIVPLGWTDCQALEHMSLRHGFVASIPVGSTAPVSLGSCAPALRALWCLSQLAPWHLSILAPVVFVHQH